MVGALRSDNGYRQFGDLEIHKLRFVQRARSLGFGVEDCRTLLSLYEDDARESAEVKEIARKHLAEIDAKLAELQDLRQLLAHLIDACAGDSRPHCPIIDELAGGPDED